MKIKSIRFQWIAFSLLISVIPLIVLQLVYFAISKGRIEKLTEDEAKRQATLIRSIALGEIHDEKEGLLLLSDFLEQQPVARLDSLRLHIANYFFTHRNRYSRASILSPDGKQELSFISSFNPEYLFEQGWEERKDLKGLSEETVKRLSEKVTTLGFCPSVYGYSDRFVLSMGELGMILADLRLKAILEDAVEQANVSPKDEVFVFDQDRTILCATEPAWNNGKADIVLDQMKAYVSHHEGGPFVLGFSGNQGPLTVGLLMHYGSLLLPLRQTLSTGLWLSLLFAGAIIVVIGFLTRRLKRSFEPLILATEEIAKGNLDHRVPPSSFRELNALSKRFNEMADQLKSVLKEMTRKEQMALLGEFSSFVIHDLKSPLSAMELLAENLDEEIQESPLSKNLSKYTRDLSVGIQEMEQFVEKILDFVRPVELTSRMIDLNDFLQQVATECSFRAELNLDPNTPLVSIDAHQFRRAMLNLVDNAGEAVRGKDGGRVIIQSLSENGKVYVKVMDNGIGIPEDALPKIFDLFYTTKPGVGGHGFGLTIVKRIVEVHGGKITVESDTDRGTTFTIELPESKSKAEAKAKE